MLRIISLNLNGIRSAAKKGCFDWLRKQKADALCVQEIKAQEADMTADFLMPGAPQSYLNGHFHYAQKKGYSGVGLYSRLVPKRVQTGFGSHEFDAEGRYVRGDFDGYSVVSLYQPSGSSGDERQQAKFRFLEDFLPHLKKLKKARREIVICGDFNIAHREIDLKNWKSNQKNSGFLPEERAWLSHVFEQVGFVDVYRKLHPETTGEAYTWWSNRGAAYEKNVGWRLDYQIATPGIAARAKAATIYKDQRFSDHAPLTIDYDWPAKGA